MTLLYIKLILAAIVGQAFQLLQKNSSNVKQAKLSNQEYSLGWFLSQDWKPIASAFLGIVTFFIVFGEIANPKHLAHPDMPFTINLFVVKFEVELYLIWNIFWLIMSFVFGGFGSYIALKAQSKASDLIMNGMDKKTTAGDIANGNDPTIPTPIPPKP